MLRIFSLSEINKLSEIKTEPFLLERQIQEITETNLNEIFQLELVKSEFELQGFRIDTLAFDRESSSFVIIEYKKDRNFLSIDQGISYLNLMLNRKADFVLEYNQNFSKTLKKDDVDWTQSRIIFIAPEFTRYQQYAIGFKDLGISLWEIQKYNNGILAYNELKPINKEESISKIIKGNSIAKKVSNEIHPYSEESLLEPFGQKIKNLYFEFKDTLISIGNDISVKSKKQYVVFKKNTAFAGIHPSNSGLRIDFGISPVEIIDPKKMA